VLEQLRAHAVCLPSCVVYLIGVGYVQAAYGVLQQLHLGRLSLSPLCRDLLHRLDQAGTRAMPCVCEFKLVNDVRNAGVVGVCKSTGTIRPIVLH
jgi:hypothetical protein